MEYLFFLTLLLVQVPILMLAVSYKRQPAYFRWTMFTLILSLSCDILAHILWMNKINPNYGGAVWGITSPVFFGLTFFSNLQWEKLKLPVFGLAGAIVVFALINLFFIQKQQINSYTSILNDFYIILLCMLYFYKQLRDLPEEDIYKTGFFWIVCGFFFMASTKLILFSFTHYLRTVYLDNLLVFAIMNNIVSLTYLCMVTYGVWLQFRKVKTIAAG